MEIEFCRYSINELSILQSLFDGFNHFLLLLIEAN